MAPWQKTLVHQLFLFSAAAGDDMQQGLQHLMSWRMVLVASIVATAGLLKLLGILGGTTAIASAPSGDAALSLSPRRVGHSEAFEWLVHMLNGLAPLV
jgi:hypothetical protein